MIFDFPKIIILNLGKFVAKQAEMHQDYAKNKSMLIAVYTQ